MDHFRLANQIAGFLDQSKCIECCNPKQIVVNGKMYGAKKNSLNLEVWNITLEELCNSLFTDLFLTWHFYPSIPLRIDASTILFIAMYNCLPLAVYHVVRQLSGTVMWVTNTGE